MKTLHLDATNPADVATAVALLQAGELVAVPTETVYGLAADASNPQAVAKIFAAKQRPADHPLITHVGDLAALASWVSAIPPWLEALAQTFWPGPLTVLLPRRAQVSPIITGGLDSIGVRIPAQPTLLALLQQSGLALAAPSANPYQKLSPTSAEQVLVSMQGRIAAVLDGGRCALGSESTIIEVSAEQVQILRSGPISQRALQAHFSQPVVLPRHHQVAVSGNKRQHYQPQARLRWATADEITARLRAKPEDWAAIVHGAAWQGPWPPAWQPHVRWLGADAVSYRHQLYASLFALDQARVKEVWVLPPPAEVEWADIHDRLQRAMAT